MGIFTPFTSPRDVRWQGAQRWHHTLFLAKTIILLLFIVLVIVEYALFKSYWVDKTGYSMEVDYTPYAFWFRIGIALIPEVILTIGTSFLILNPMHRSTYSFHPVFALTTSLIMFGLYLSVLFLNALLVASNEVSFHSSDTWYQITYVEVAFQSILELMWIAFVVFSCIAVHKWRMAKKSESVKLAVLNQAAHAKNGEETYV